MDTVRLRRANRRQAQGLSGKLTDLYMDSRGTPLPEAYRRPSRRHFLNRLTADIRRPGFAMVIAETDGLGRCASGFPVRGDGFWRFGFGAAPPRGIEQLTASSGVFAIIDFPVRPHPQDAHVARRSQERLLRSWGRLAVGEIRKPITATLLRVPVLPVGERTAPRLAGLAHDAWTRWPA